MSETGYTNERLSRLIEPKPEKPGDSKTGEWTESHAWVWPKGDPVDWQPPQWEWWSFVPYLVKQLLKRGHYVSIDFDMLEIQIDGNEWGADSIDDIPVVLRAFATDVLEATPKEPQA